MSGDLTDAIIDCAVEGPVIVTRVVGIAIERGRKGETTTEEFPITASITPIAGQDIRRLGSGFSAEGTHLILTPTKLFTAKSSSHQMPDIVDHKDNRYQISKVLDWFEQGGFYECVGTEINP